MFIGLGICELLLANINTFIMPYVVNIYVYFNITTILHFFGIQAYFVIAWLLGDQHFMKAYNFGILYASLRLWVGIALLLN